MSGGGSMTVDLSKYTGEYIPHTMRALCSALLCSFTQASRPRAA